MPEREPATVGELHRPAGSLARAPWSLELTQSEACWSWSSLRVLTLAPGGAYTFSTGDEEVLVLPLAGSCVVSCDGAQQTLNGRVNVFEGPTDFAYAPPASSVQVTSEGGGRFAVPGAKGAKGAKAELRLPFRYQPAGEVPVELRGAGNCSRRVVNYCMPASFEAERLLACEVVTPAGNWSSYPPHKHDEDHVDETELEEILLLRGRRWPERPGRLRFPARLRHCRASDRPARGGPQRRRRDHPPRLPRPLDGRSRVRPLLPQRNGRPRRTGVAGHRRPRTRLGQVHLARPAHRLPAGHT